MKCHSILLFVGIFLFGTAHSQVEFRRIDSTLKIGKAGYRIDCRNKSIVSNPLSIKPVGFESGANEINFPLRGRVASVQVDDLNRDSYPDLVVFIYTDSAAIKETVYTFVSDGNKSIVPCMLPDISMDGKLNVGYKGYDQFDLMEGTVVQKFPIYKEGDEKDKPTGGNRVLLYQLVKNENGGFKFNRIRVYDTK